MALVLSSHHKVTYDELASWPDDGRRYELYDGEVSELNAPLPKHQMALLELAVRVRAHAQSAGGLILVSPIDIVFNETNVLQPDIVVFTHARKHLVDINRVIRVPPDVAVEVTSPTTAGNDRIRKFNWFERFGVREYWILDPVREQFEAHMRGRDAYIPIFTGGRGEVFVSDVLDGFTCSVDSMLPWPPISA
jgi:Uma2 family endonuclease